MLKIEVGLGSKFKVLLYKKYWTLKLKQHLENQGLIWHVPNWTKKECI